MIASPEKIAETKKVLILENGLRVLLETSDVDAKE